MPSMIDPMGALVQFQEAFKANRIPVQRGRRDASLLLAYDEPHDTPRFSYMRAMGKTLIALVMFARNGSEEGYPVFNVGYAVANDYRGRGLAKSTLVAGLAELSTGLAGAGIPIIHIEAVISPQNIASHAVARAVFDGAPTSIIDSVSGAPALLYTRIVDSRRGSAR
jgi:RimJ/RimL family protein N-acetyltransferase